MKNSIMYPSNTTMILGNLQNSSTTVTTTLLGY